MSSSTSYCRRLLISQLRFTCWKVNKIVCSKSTINTLELHQLGRFYIIIREIWRQILIAVMLSPTLSGPYDGTNKYYICNETFHYEKCKLLCVQDGKCIFAASMESFEIQYKVFFKTLWFSVIIDFPTLTDFLTGFN